MCHTILRAFLYVDLLNISTVLLMCLCVLWERSGKESIQKLLVLDITSYGHIMLLKAIQGGHVVYCALSHTK